MTVEYRRYRRHLLKCPGGCAHNAYCETERRLDADASAADWRVERAKAG